MAINDLEKMNNYNPTNYVNNSEPDIDADNLNKTENKLAETVEKANQIIDTLKTLISTVQTNSETTVPSSSLAYSMQQEITKNKEDIAATNSNLASIGTGTQLAVLSMDNKTMTGISFKNYKTIEIMVIIQQTSNGNMFFNFTIGPLVSHILDGARYITIPGKSYGYCANILLSINYSAGTVTLMEADINTGFTLNAIYILGLK